MSDELRNGNPMADPGLARLYREAAREEPPAHLDAAILAAARRDTDARPWATGSAWLRSWRLPVSIAAVVALSVSLVTLMIDEGDDRLTAPPRRAPDSPAKAGVDRESAPLPAQPAESTPPATVAAPATGTVEARPSAREAQPAESGSAKEAKRAEPVATPGAAPQPFPAAPQTGRAERRESESKPTLRDMAPQPPAAAMDSPAPAGKSAADLARAPVVGEETPRAAAPAPLMRNRAAPEAAASSVARPTPQKSALIREYENRTPEKWLEKIAELRRDGKTAEADELLAEFKKRFPEHPLPATLR